MAAGELGGAAGTRGGANGKGEANGGGLGGLEGIAGLVAPENGITGFRFPRVMGPVGTASGSLGSAGTGNSCVSPSERLFVVEPFCGSEMLAVGPPSGSSGETCA